MHGMKKKLMAHKKEMPYEHGKHSLKTKNTKEKCRFFVRIFDQTCATLCPSNFKRNMIRMIGISMMLIKIESSLMFAAR